MAQAHRILLQTTTSGAPAYEVIEIARNPERLGDVKTYVANVARWLAPEK